MKKYFLDTNVILRFLLKDNEKYYNQARGYFEKAKRGEIELNLIPEVLFEIDYVLRGVYSLTKDEVVDILLKLIKTPYLAISNRGVLITTVDKYQSTHVDLFDVYLYYYSLSKGTEVLSFDKDFEKIMKK
ncbi:MAG: PIN domain-containing protein [Patescibacteria group bacterium]